MDSKTAVHFKEKNMANTKTDIQKYIQHAEERIKNEMEMLAECKTFWATETCTKLQLRDMISLRWKATEMVIIEQNNYLATLKEQLSTM
jgi:Tfp pilus assembly protein PilP